MQTTTPTSTDLRDELREATALAHENWSRLAGARLASEAGVAEDLIWRIRADDTLDGQVASGYAPSTVREIVGTFAAFTAGKITDWVATPDLRGVEAAGSFAGMRITVWGTV